MDKKFIVSCFAFNCIYIYSKNRVLIFLLFVNNFNCKFDVNGFLKQTWSDWEDNIDEDNICDELLNRISGYSFPKDYHKVINILKSKYTISRK
jgi:hypothetical protein